MQTENMTEMVNEDKTGFTPRVCFLLSQLRIFALDRSQDAVDLTRENALR